MCDLNTHSEKVQAVVFYEACMRLCPDNPNAFQNYLLALNYIHPGESPFVCDAHAEWGRQLLRQLRNPFTPLGRKCWPQLRGRKLRVGYVSPDLYHHSVSYFAEAPLSHHNRDRVEVCGPSLQ
jgi:protein O-GlcNAc transferase